MIKFIEIFYFFLRDGSDVQFMRLPQDKLSTLKTEYITTVVPSDSIKKYSIPWTEKGLDPLGCKEHAEYLNEICEVFESRMKGMIDKNLQGRTTAAKDPLKTNMYKELLHHASFCKAKCR